MQILKYFIFVPTLEKFSVALNYVREQQSFPKSKKIFSCLSLETCLKAYLSLLLRSLNVHQSPIPKLKNSILYNSCSRLNVLEQYNQSGLYMSCCYSPFSPSSVSIHETMTSLFKLLWFLVSPTVHSLLKLSPRILKRSVYSVI